MEFGDHRFFILDKQSGQYITSVEPLVFGAEAKLWVSLEELIHDMTTYRGNVFGFGWKALDDCWFVGREETSDIKNLNKLLLTRVWE